jgi:hypothetical protein
MKNINATRDPNTSDMFPMPKRGRGRPRKADALSNAERQRRFRARRKLEGSPRERDAVDLLASAFRDVIEAEARAIQLVESMALAGDPHAARLAGELRAVLRRASGRFA